ncbi:MAG: hypothetical protein V4572_03805 [Bacteroidota bacterium]
MSQISINTIPTIPVRTPKKLEAVSWLSDVVRDKKSLDNKNSGFDKDFNNKK